MALSRSGRGVLPLALALALLATMTGAVQTATTDPAAAAQPWIDTTDRQAVITAYNAEFGRPAPRVDWSGASRGCLAGTTSSDHHSDVFRRINFFRALAGVPAGITENSTYSTKAQAAALMVSRSGRVSQTPDDTFACYNSDASQAATNSNLFLGFHGADAVNGYMRDEGVANAAHRSVLLHPSTREMGSGDVPLTSSTHAANALWVFDGHLGESPTGMREAAEFIAWPPRGHVPSELVYPTWSFSAPDADFGNASVTMTSGGSSVELSVDHRGRGDGAPFPSLTWTPSNVGADPGRDTTYRVTVDRAVIRGSTTTVSYDVIILASNATSTIGAGYRPFIGRAHQDFLGRTAGPAELDYWSRQLASGISRFHFVEELSASEAWTTAVVDRLYLETLGRAADPGGRTYWARQLQLGTPVAAVAAAFYGSPEYVALKGSNYEPWIIDLYQVLLGRTPDNAGLRYWSGMAADEGPGVVAYRLYQSKESRRARVVETYLTFLGRQPDAAGLTYWTDVLASGDDLRLAANLAGSNEYFQHSSGG